MNTNERPFVGFVEVTDLTRQIVDLYPLGVIMATDRATALAKARDRWVLFDLCVMEWGNVEPRVRSRALEHDWDDFLSAEYMVPLAIL